MHLKTWFGQALALWLPIALACLHHCLARTPAVQTVPPPLKTDAVDLTLAKARGFLQSGRLTDASSELSGALQAARVRHDATGQAKLLRALSGCRIRLFDYRGAKQAAEDSRALALRQNDLTTAGGATINLASVYLLLGDYPQADREAARAADLLKNSPNKEILLKALLIYANTEAERIRIQREAERMSASGVSKASDIGQLEENYQRGIRIAKQSEGSGQNEKIARMEAQLWEELGYSLLLVQYPDKAEEPLRRARSLESAAGDADALATNDAHQAELELQRAHYTSALALIDRAIASRSNTFRNIPRFYPLYTRALVLEKLNRGNLALAELKKAVNAANTWRHGVLPGDTTRTRTVVELHNVYNEYAQLAANIALKTHDEALVRNALEVLAENRAANLREEVKRAYSQKQRLPPRYFDLLAELQSVQARISFGDDRPEDKAELNRVRLEIDSIENDLGFDDQNSLKNGERNLDKNSLKSVQTRLDRDEVLLSFSLGPEMSFLWAVTEESVKVYKLAGENSIGDSARRFATAVQRRQPAVDAASHLTQELFGQLPPAIWKRPKWLLVGDGVLLGGVPFAALTDLSAPGGKSLADSHSLRFIPSEFMLLSRPDERARKVFAGVGDPIYNVADSRNEKTPRTPPKSGHAATALSRLVGSDREIRTAAKESGLSQSEILVGSQATVASLQKVIAEEPEILHFAVHVVNPDMNRAPGDIREASEAALALSLTSDRVPELLTPEAIATLRLPGSLVILSGCSSQKGEILPGAGLMGLSRAWLLAGASAVVVSAWPTPDDSGRFFSSFYKHFDAVPSGTLAGRAAAALQQAQVEMEHGGGYRSSPNFWGAYSIISKE